MIITLQYVPSIDPCSVLGLIRWLRKSMPPSAIVTRSCNHFTESFSSPWGSLRDNVDFYMGAGPIFWQTLSLCSLIYILKVCPANHCRALTYTRLTCARNEINV